MSFKARRLRVQFPCPPGTVIEQEARGPGCAFPTDVCEGGTCWFETPIDCRFQSACGAFASFCEYPTDCGITNCGPTPCRFGTPCAFYTCRYPTWCEFRSCGPASGCRHFTAVGCPPATDVVIDPGKIVVDPEQLPALREALEARLKEIEAAEQALKEYEKAAEEEEGGKGRK